MIYIGIDNAISGGLAAISPHGMIIAKSPMPVKNRTHIFEKTKKRRIKGVLTKITAKSVDTEIDPLAVKNWISETTDGRECVIAIEECPEHAQQKSIMRSMAISYGILLGAMGAALPRYRLVIVRSGNPKDSWQRHMLPKCEQGETKAAAIAAASQLWPDESWLASPRCSTPDTGMIDAALIAEYARISNL